MQIHSKGFRTLLGLLCLVWALSLALPIPQGNSVVYRWTVDVSKSNSVETFNVVTSFPFTVSFLTTSVPVGASLSWDFGDGTSGVGASPTHSYSAPCVYYIQLMVATGRGTVVPIQLVLGVFDGVGIGGRALAVCPSVGSAGITQTRLTGAYFAAHANLTVMLDGNAFTSVIAGDAGDWTLNATNLLPPRPNGSVYTFSSSPGSFSQTFTSLEGITAAPTSGSPGTQVTVTGRSYPADTSVQVFLGGVSLGTAQTDGDGSFQTQFRVPSVYPLSVAGTYSFTSDPPILGTGASFSSSGGGGTGTNTQTGQSYPWWWLVLIILVLAVIILILVILLVRRRRSPSEQVMGQVAAVGTAPVF